MPKNSSKETEMKQSEAGLADVVACQSDICFIDGENCRLVYRGYDALDLAMNSNFEEVAYLLWYGCLPRITEFKAFLSGFTGSMALPGREIVPGAPPARCAAASFSISRGVFSNAFR